MTDLDLNLFDGIVLVLALLALVRGFRRGVLGQVFELGGGFVGLLIGVALGPRVAGLFTDRAEFEGALVSLAVVFVALSLGQTLGYILGRNFTSIARRARLGSVDAIAGGLFGVAVTLVSYWLIGSLLVNVPVRSVAAGLADSRLLRAMNDVSEPPDLISYLRQYLVTSNFPQVFVGLPPPTGPPVELPSDRQARRAVRAADQSTVRVLAAACGGTQLGSGWIGADDTVVTNAHVVAGSTSVSVQQSSNEVDATVVLFDDDTDIAILHADGLTGPVLRLNEEDLDRGSPGAILGFPGSDNGTLDTESAAVQARFVAAGKDIYGRSTVTREVYELRALVREGHSGGPFVVPSGEVAGVVFAASTARRDTGYALTGSEVADQLATGADLTDATGTGDCTR